MRDIVVFLIFLLVLPASFARPWIGIIAFSWLAYNRTQDLCWGFVRNLPLSQFIAIAMILGWFLMEFRPLPFRDARIKAMVGIFVALTISIAMNRLRWPVQSKHLFDLAKVLFIAILTSAMLINRSRLRHIMFVIACGMGFYGAKNGLMYSLAGSKSIVGPGGMLLDNNNFALAMVMNVPMLYYLADELRQMKYGKHVYMFMRIAVVLTFLTIVSTGSRGGFLSLGAVLVCMAWKTKYKLPAIGVLALVGFVGVLAAPAAYKARISTIFAKDADRDASVRGRLISWAVAGNMIRANPVWGIGFQNMVYEYNNYTQGIPVEHGEKEHFARVAHNSYLQLWSESGSIAFICFMFMLLSTIIGLQALGRRAAQSERDRWLIPYVNAIQIAMVGYVVGATFLDRAHFDLIYQLVAIAVALPGIMLAERVVTRRVAKRKGPGVAKEVWVRHHDPFVPVRHS